VTEDRALAADWFARFEGAGLDGVIAKRLDGPYEPGKRGWEKVKHARTADVAVAGFRWHKDEAGTGVGSLIIGLHDEAGTLHHVGVASGFSAARRRELVEEVAPLREGAIDGHPCATGHRRAGRGAYGRRMPGAQAAGSGQGPDWSPSRGARHRGRLRPLQGDRPARHPDGPLAPGPPAPPAAA